MNHLPTEVNPLLPVFYGALSRFLPEISAHLGDWVQEPDKITKGYIALACIAWNLVVWAIFLYAKGKHDRNGKK